MDGITKRAQALNPAFTDAIAEAGKTVLQEGTAFCELIGNFGSSLDIFAIPSPLPFDGSDLMEQLPFTAEIGLVAIEEVRNIDWSSASLEPWMSYNSIDFYPDLDFSSSQDFNPSIWEN